MFRENRQLYLDKGAAAKAMLNPLSSSESRANILNSNEEAVPHNTAMLETASQEFKNPISSIFKSTRHALAQVLWHLPKSAVTKTLGMGTDLVTGAAGIAANVPRWGLDLIRFVPRVPLIGLDYLADLYGKLIPVNIRKIREKIHNTLGTTSFINAEFA